VESVRAAAVVLDVNDLGRAVAFWAGLLQSEPDSTSHETWVDVARLGEGGPVLTLQLVKHSKNRLHLDLAVPDFPTARRRALSLGAKEVSAVHQPIRPWQVLADPDGNEFCLTTA
jgi:predicted enzyme related to lactoylglutathione lyase